MLPDALSIFLFAQAFQADANYLFGLTDRRRVLAPPAPAPGHQAGQGAQHGNGDQILEIAREIGERFPAGASITIHYGGSMSMDGTSWVDLAGKSLLKMQGTADFDMSLKVNGVGASTGLPGGTIGFTGKMDISMAKLS